MKKFYCTALLCAAMIVAPSVGWSDTVDELWTQGRGFNSFNNNMLPELEALDTTALSTQQLWKFIVALPGGLEVANQVMNDRNNRVLFAQDSFYLDQDPQYLLDGLIVASVGGFVGFGMLAALTFGKKTLGRIRPALPLYIVAGPIVLLWDTSRFLDTHAKCGMEIDSFTETRASYKISGDCLELNNGRPYAGYINIVDKGDASSTILVEARQGIFKYDPEAQAFVRN